MQPKMQLDNYSQILILFLFLDIDECSRGQYSCGANMKCNNVPGNYSCNCLNGFELAAVGNYCKGKEMWIYTFMACKLHESHYVIKIHYLNYNTS